MNVNLKISVVGGSVGGLFAGVLLHRAGFDVTVFERSKQSLEDRGAGLGAQSDLIEILEEVGRGEVTQMGVLAKERIFLSRDNLITNRIASPQMTLSWDRIFLAFRELMPDDRYCKNKEAVEVRDDGSQCILTFSDGSIEQSDLVIGADGVNSVVRRLVTPLDSPSYAGYVAWRGLFPETAFLKEDGDLLLDRFSFYNMPHSQILGYVVPGPDGSLVHGTRRYNWVWYRQARGSEALAKMLQKKDGRPGTFSLSPGSTPTVTVQELLQEARNVLPRSFAAAVEAEPRPFAQAIYDYAASSMAKGRVALLGDAACIARPHTAMGVSKAAGDALSLRDALISFADPLEALFRYSLARKSVADEIVTYGRRLGAFLG